MLPRQHKLSGTDNFRATTRYGKKARTSTVLVSAHKLKTEADIALWGGPRFGFVISKKVGNSVVRHHIARQLRHIVRKYTDIIPRGYNCVIRVLPKAAHSDSYQLERDLVKAMKQLGLIAARNDRDLDA